MRLPWLGVACCCAVLAACGGSTPTGPSKTPTLARTRFLAFGDSMTSGEVTVPAGAISGWPETGVLGPPNTTMILVPAASYPAQLLSMLQSRYVTQAATVSMANAGKPGEFTFQAQARFSESFSAANPDVVLLLEGANDLAIVGSDLPWMALQDMTLEAQRRGARVFVGNQPPTIAGRKLSPPIVEFEAFNRKVEAMALSNGAVFVNLYAAMLPNVDTLIGADGLHPTEAGYKRIAEIFYAAIQANLEVK